MLGLQVTFTASVAPTVDSVLLGPSDGVVLFSVAGSTALAYVQKSILGSAMVARTNAVAGTAQLTVEKSSKGLILLPGALKLCNHCCTSKGPPRLAYLVAPPSGMRPRPLYGQPCLRATSMRPI